MSSSDEHLYRGDPAPPQYGPPPGYAPPPGYGQAPYGQAPYGQAPHGPPPGYGYPLPYRPTNQLAIVSLVLAFVFAPAGLIVGIIARKQIRRTGEDGVGLALAGIIVGGISTAFFVLFLVFWIIAFASISSGSFGP